MFFYQSRDLSLICSRSDSSGTHAAEVSIWKTANFDPIPHSGLWYYETGQGMGQSINIAIAKDAYLLRIGPPGLNIRIRRIPCNFISKDKNILRNNYGLILVNYSRCKKY